jgi:predicted alpha/beta-hydrolase family hydrolase
MKETIPISLDPESLTIQIAQELKVSALVLAPSAPRALYVLAHGAGAGMTHPWLEAFAIDLLERQIATLRFQFPFMERGSKRPDTPDVAHSAIRAAVATGARHLPGVPLIAGGRSLGGRMTSQTQAKSALPNVRGLAFLGFPLHPAKRPSIDRARHLSDVHIPMLFLQGTRDDLADLEKLKPVCAQLGSRATLHIVEQADHGFHVPARSGRTNQDVRREISDTVVKWLTLGGL